MISLILQKTKFIFRFYVFSRKLAPVKSEKNYFYFEDYYLKLNSLVGRKFSDHTPPVGFLLYYFWSKNYI